MRDHDERLVHLLWEVSERTNALGEAAIAATALTRPALGLLDVIATSPGIVIAEIARRLPKTQQAISQVVAKLEAAGLVERRLLDGRRIGLYVTAQGTRTRAAGTAAEVAFEEHLQVLLGEAKYDRLCRLLSETRALVEKLDADSVRPVVDAARPPPAARGAARGHPHRRVKARPG